jgi:GTP-binding protein
LLLIDATEFITAQDMHIAGYIMEVGKGIVLVVNKWDLIPRTQRREFKQRLERRLKFMSYVPTIYISARLGQNINRVLSQAWQVYQEGQKRLPCSEVDAAIKQAISTYPPPRRGSKQVHIIQAYQDESRPSTFVLQVNDPRLVHSSYRRYLENKLRQNFGLHGVPLQLVFTKATHRSAKKMEVVKT